MNTKSKLFTYSERHLQCVWADSEYRPHNLTTEFGEKVTVESPGRWNMEAGPDFLDAVILVGEENKKIIGDVEIHIHPTDWVRHSHLEDPRYSNVAVHVSYFHGTLPSHYIPADVIQIGIMKNLNSTSGFSFEDIDVSAYPHAIHQTSHPPCSDALKKHETDWILNLLETSGEERMAIKTARMKAAIEKEGEMQALYRELMTALGYKNNKKNFRRLAELVPLETLLSEETSLRGYAILLGVSGLIPSTTEPHWDKLSTLFVREIWDVWWKTNSLWEDVIMNKALWQTSGMRPHNHPLRRMAAGASIAYNLSSIKSQLTRSAETDPRKWCKNAISIIKTSAEMPYWKNRLSIGGSRNKSEIALIGDRRAATILSNVVIPYLAAIGMDIKEILPHLPPEESNNITRQMAFTLLTRDHNPAALETALRQQGLIQIFQDFCLTNKEACKNCRLPESLTGISTHTVPY